MKDAFSAFHPAINFFYFSVVILFGMLFLHPFFLLLSLLAALLYSLRLNGKKTLRFVLLFILPMLLAISLINPLFNSMGMTVLTYFNDRPVTLEALLYGAASGVMFGSVLLWFSCFHAVMTSDKLLHLFGRIFPALSLIFCMVLRLVPKLKKQIYVISRAQKGIMRDAGSGNPFRRARNGMKLLSILTTWALENAVETADSMRSRGYGLKGRKSYSDFRFTSRDWCALAFLCALFAFLCVGAVLGENTVSFFPTVIMKRTSLLSALLYASYFLFLMFPVLIDLSEDFKWIRMKSGA